jgi:hypothetical protein
VTIPSAENVVIGYLNGELSTRVLAETPSKTQEPWIRVGLLDDPSVEGPHIDRTIRALMQIDCYAGRDAHGAITIADQDRRLVREALRVMPQADVAGAVVSSTKVLNSTRIPDQSFEPAMQRYAMTVEIVMRAA